ncbi:hypothetical protein ABZ153_36955, partial [Streptomyces sp. NPDC006290]|uniref:hypothetical protein n=1 Tax=Streptomyces sp. NPDC006290 TaxID=3156745 RepID=UPI0033A356B9
TTSATARPSPFAPDTTRAACRSRSALWSADDTRQYATTRPDGWTATSSTNHVPDGAWRTGTGIFPSLTHRQAVW